jgi:alpha-1,4-digalacturonate transport system substrate-binding protein
VKYSKLWLALLLVLALALGACQTAAPSEPVEEPAAEPVATEPAVAEPEATEAAAEEAAPTEEAIEEAVPTEEAAEEAASGDVVELRMVWYSDGNEGEVMRDLLDRFETDNPDIRVVMDVVAYTAILENLPIQLAAGEGPDMARVTDLGGLSEYYLNLLPYLDNADYWEESFGPFLDWLRPVGDEEGIYGFMTQLTVTGPFVNKTLFDQAGVEMPGPDATWEDWAEVTRQVAEATGTPFAMAMDRTGHRFAGPAISQGASFFNEEGYPAVDDEGFRRMSELLIGWHQDGTMPMEVWAGSTGYAPANELFVNGQVVLYMSGSWQIGQFSQSIGDAFDWVVVPNPCGPNACTGMPGGAALVALSETEHPEEVARVMNYLVQPDILNEFSARTLFIPGHLGLAEAGVDYDTDLQLAADALDVFVAEVGKLHPTAFDLQAYPLNRVIFDATRDRLTQAIVGELTLDDAIQRIQEDIDALIEEAGQ